MRLLILVLALLALTSSARAAPPDWGTAREIEVRLSSFAYTPGKIELDRGEPVRLVLINDQKGSRSFGARRFFAAAQVAPSDQSRVRGGVVRLRPGERTSVRLVAPGPGRYPLRSSGLAQAALGLTGEIVVR